MATVDCLCPPTAEGKPRHATDTVTLRPTLDFRTAATIQHSVSVLRMEESEPEVEEVLARLTEAYVKFGVESWTVVDTEGKPVPVSPKTVEAILFPNITAAMVVGDEADELYSGAILLPLLARASTSSQDTPTLEPTSPLTSSPQNTPTPLKPSSITTSQTDGTETTSSLPDGASSSSLSLASVG